MTAHFYADFNIYFHLFGLKNDPWSNTERIRIDMSLLLNNYPPNFIAKQFNRFFHLNNAMPVITQLNEDVYHQLHQTLLHQLTRREKKFNTMM